MASSEDSTSDVNQIFWYRDKALSMMYVCEARDQLKFHKWLNRFEYVANIIHVPKDKMVEFFDIMVNDQIHNYIQRLNPNINAHELSYECKIKYYFYNMVSKNHNMIRMCFKDRNQYEKEPIKYYANFLRMLFKKCAFKYKTREEILHEKFLNGLREDDIRTHLKSIQYKSFDDMVAKAIEFEKVHLETYYRDHALLKIDTYNKEKEGEFYDWLNKFEYVAYTIDVPESKMGKLFIQMIDNDVNCNVMQTNPFVDLNKLSYDMIITFYIRYFYPNIVEFYTPLIFCRKQYERETIENYAQSLKNIFNKCTYTNNLLKQLYEHFINGLRENEVINHLRKTKYKTFNELVASAIEFAKVNVETYYRDRAFLKIDIYNEVNEGEFFAWLNRFEYVADTIDVPNSKMVKLFIEMIDNDVNQSVMQANPSVDLNKLSYDMIIDYYLRFYTPKEKNLHKNRVISRYQYEYEPTKSFVFFLRKNYKKSNYTMANHMDLYVTFLNGLRENDTRINMVKLPNETFDNYARTAIRFEKVHLITHYRDRALSMINIYNPRKEGFFYTWLNKLEYVANRIDVPESKMGEFFIEMVDNDLNRNVMEANPSAEFDKLSSYMIIDYYLRYFYPNIVEIYKLLIFSRTQYERETIESYAQCLKNLFNKCTYTTNLLTKLYEHFISGLRENKIKKHLRSTKRKTFNGFVASAIEFAKANLITYYRDQALLKIDIYNERKEGEFFDWLNKFEYVADMINVPDSKMVKLFIKMIDNEVYQCVMQAYPFVDLNKLSYDIIIDCYLRFYNPNDNNLHRSRFIARYQYEQEPTKTYVYFLRKYYNKSNYNVPNHIDLCTSFLSGLREIDTKIYLQEVTNVSFDELVQIAIEFEKANLLSHYLDQALSMINIYNPRKEGFFYVWFKRFESVADKIEVPDSRKSQLFFEMIDDNVHQNVMETFTSVKISELPYNQIKQHYLFYFSSSFIENSNISQSLPQV